MIRITAILLTAVFLIGFIGCQNTKEKEIKSEKMFREYFESWNTHDVEKIASLFVSGDMLACEWVMTGTLSGNSPELPATGKSFSVRGATIAQLKDEKIQRNADYWDLATFRCGI